MKKVSKLFFLQVFCILIFCTISFAQGMGIKVGEKAPDFKLKELTSGKEVSLSDYKGKKIVLIEFWATWCAICKREIPYMVNYYNTNKKNDDFEILAIMLPSGDNEKDKKEVNDLISKYKIPYPILEDVGGKVAEKYELSGLIPIFAVLDKDGVVQFEQVGEISPQEDPISFVLEDLREKYKEKGGK